MGAVGNLAIEAQQEANKALSSQRIFVEHLIRVVSG